MKNPNPLFNCSVTPPVFPEKSLGKILTDRESARMLLKSLVGTVFPIRGGTCAAAEDLAPGTFGVNCTAGDYHFQSGTKVGIGTTSPQQPLEVFASGNGGLRISSQVASSYNFNIQAVGGSGTIDWEFLTNDAAGGTKVPMYFKSSTGYVGIGTTNPQQPLEVFASGNGGLRISSQAASSYNFNIQAVGGSGTVDWEFLTNDAAGGTKIPMYFKSSTGYVGIGTTAPQQPLTLGASKALATEMAFPSGVSATLASGGTLTLSQPYYYVVTAIDGLGGETVQSSEVTATPTVSGTQTINLSWSGVPGAASYKVYRSTTSGSYGSGSHLAGNPSAASFSDTGVSLSAGNPPTVTTAYASTLIPGGIDVTGGIGFRPTIGASDKNVIYLSGGGSDLTILRNYSQVYTIMEFRAPKPDSGGNSEATLSLTRVDSSDNDIESIDLYNNGYFTGTNISTQYGIRIQKRGSGSYRDFVFDQYDGNMSHIQLPIMTLKADRTVAFKSHADNATWTGTDSIRATAAVKTTTNALTTLATIALDDTRSCWIVVKVTARQSGGTNHAFFHQEALYKTEGLGAAQVGLQDLAGAPLPGAFVPAGWSIALNVSGNNVLLQVTGPAATTIYWVATVEYQSVSTDA